MTEDVPVYESYDFTKEELEEMDRSIDKMTAEINEWFDANQEQWTIK